MSGERQKENLDEVVKNAATGYMTVVLGVVCFVLLLVAIAAVVRLIVGASAGVGM